jgi:ligand-binding sensor domain-containing protein/tRNA A-37 threonylcarbamoyl transferase component Bud32
LAQRGRNYAEHCVRTFLACAVAALSAICASGQHYPAVAVQGSPSGIYVMVQDSKSRLWMGTIDDVYCFDGEHFYSLRPYGFPTETPNAIAEDGDGDIWIGTQGTDASGGTRQGSLYRYHAGKVERILPGDVLGIVSISPGMLVASMGTEAVGHPTYGDLYRIRKVKGAWVTEKLLSRAVHHMTVDHHDNVLFPCPGGWCEFPKTAVGGWQGPALPAAYRQHTGDPLTERVVRDKYDCIWSRAEIRASYQCAADQQPQFLPYSLSQDDASSHLEESPDGSMFMLVPLLFGRPGNFHTLHSAELPPGLDTAMVAKDGTIWLGTDHGLYRMPYPFQLEYWGKQDGIVGPQLFIQRIGNQIFTSANGVVRLSADRRQWAPIPGTDKLRVIRDITVLKKDRILATSMDGAAVYGMDGKIFARSSSGTGEGFRLAQTRDGTIWMGKQGVSRVILQGGRISFDPQPVPPDNVVDMRYDATRDILWVTQGRELLFYTQNSWHTISQNDGLLDADCGIIALIADGSLWMGYGNAAYALIENPASGHPVVHNFTGDLDKVVGSNAVNYLAADSTNRLWLTNATLNVATLQGAREDQWIPLGQSDGISPAAGSRIAFFTDSDGSIWFAADIGIMHFSPPSDFTTNFPIPPIAISAWSVGQEAPQLADARQQLPRNQQVTAYIGSLQFNRRKAVHLRYRLLPEQAEWSAADAFDLHLGKLHWGKHRLQVQARMGNGDWSQTEEQSFTVVKPVWLTWPAIAGYVVFGGIFAEAGRRWRKRRIERAQKALPELAEWRLTALSPELHELHGTLLQDRFEVGRVLARGGFATIAEGRDQLQGGRRCAIKIFRQELVDKEWMVRRFQHEVRALEQIHHPNVVRIYGSGALPNGALYLVMEFIEGGTLREVLEIGKFAPHRVAAFLTQAGSALDEIHSHGICHRDLKPENLMIRLTDLGKEELVLIDFSIAIVKDPDETLHGLSRAAGTIYYMAPEQAIGYADASTDIYSLAKIVIEMMTGKRLSVLLPNASIDLPDRVRELLQTMRSGLSSASIELISSALEFDPSRRPKSAGDFALRIAADLQADLIIT